MKKISSNLFIKIQSLWKMKIVLTLFFSLTAFSLLTACEKKNNNENESFTLENTKWKLAGIMNTETEELRILEPTDCDQCYTLTFVSETTAMGFSITDYKIGLNLSQLGSYMLNADMEPFDGSIFRKALFDPNTKSYTATSTELKFINSTDNYYLLFKPL